MKTRTQAEWIRILMSLGVRSTVAADWAPVFANTIGPGTFSAGDADLQDFLGQIIHESEGLTRMGENLRYRTPERLMAVWPTRFRTVASAMPFVNNPEALANSVYAGRLGNIAPDDGWRFRGRSPVQITGRANYEAVGRIVGQDLTVMPELLEQPHFALEAAIAWWEDRIPDSMLGDPIRVTKRVNGGLIGLAHRTELTDDAGQALA